MILQGFALATVWLVIYTQLGICWVVLISLTGENPPQCQGWCMPVDNFGSCPCMIWCWWMNQATLTLIIFPSFCLNLFIIFLYPDVISPVYRNDVLSFKPPTTYLPSLSIQVLKLVKTQSYLLMILCCKHLILLLQYPLSRISFVNSIYI